MIKEILETNTENYGVRVDLTNKSCPVFSVQNSGFVLYLPYRSTPKYTIDYGESLWNMQIFYIREYIYNNSQFTSLSKNWADKPGTVVVWLAI